MIFSSFKPVDYAGKPMTDIFRNYRSYIDQATKNLILRDYLIEASDRPELISWKLYGDSQYYWIILMLNNNYDPFHGWIKSQDAVHQTVEYSYSQIGGGNQVAYHINDRGKKYYNLFEDPDFPGHWYDKIDPGMKYLQYQGPLVPVTIIEDKLSINEDKRTIKIVSPGDLNAFLSSYKRVIGNI
ncbi:baseplate wedge subunit [Citrobacter phage Ci1]|nr:baseplate wedge subunit [Citrobacter phage Ci1]